MTNERRVVHDTQRTLLNMTTLRFLHLATVFLLVLSKSQNTLSLSVLNYSINHNIQRKALLKRTLGMLRRHHHQYQYGHFQNFKRASYNTKIHLSAQSQQEEQRKEISSSPFLNGIEHHESTCIINNKNDARTIMNAILARYDNDDNSGGNNSNKKAAGRKSFNPAWKKTRNYLYHACSPSSSTRKRKNATTRRTTKNPLTYQEVMDVLTFLDTTFPENARLICHILQSTPRILRKPPMLLQANAQFLHDLYGPQNLFHVAISRNPTLLIVSGVTQNPQQYYKNLDNQGSNYQHDNIQQIHVFLKEELNLSATQMSKLKKTTLLCSIPYERFYDVMTFLQSILRKDDHEFDSSNDTVILIEKEKQQQQMNNVLWKIVSCHAQVFNLSVETNLQPRIQFIQDRCGFSKSQEWMQLLKSCPAILGFSVQDNLKPTIDFLAMVLTDTYNDQNQYDRKNEIVANSENGENSGTEQLLLRKCLLSHPQLLALSLRNLQSKVAYFDYIDKLEETTIERPTVSSTIPTSSLASRIATKSPVIYSLSLKENIIPKINFLSKVWGASAPRTTLLEQDAMNHNNYEVLLRQLQEQHTQNVSEQTETQLPVIQDSLSKRLKEYPNVLTLSLEGNIQPTMDFFRRTGYAALDSDFYVVDVNRNVKDQERQQGTDVHQSIPGRYIASSLFNRLLPRWHFYMQKCTAGVQQKHEQSDDNNHLLDKPPLHILVGATDASFCEYIGCSLPELQEFTKESAPRLKFSSQWDTWLRTGRPIDDT